MALRHIALFRWQDGTTPEQVAQVEKILTALPTAIPELASYSFGKDVGISEGAYDFAVVADVADETAFVTYRDHPEHQAALAVIKPMLSERAALQFAIPGK